MSNAELRAATGAFTHVQRAVLVAGTVLVVAAAVPILVRGNLDDLLLLAFLAAVLWTGAIGGPGAGGVAAVAATAAFTLIEIPDLFAGVGSGLLASRGIAFILVGTGTGFLTARLRNILGRVESYGLRDYLSNTFSAAYMNQLVLLLTEEHKRYGKTFGLIEIPPVLTPDEIGDLGRALRNTTRSSDAVGRSEDGGFLVLLTNASRDSVRIVARRLKQACAKPGRDELPMKVYSAPEDLEELERLAAAVTPAADSDRD